MPNLDDYLENLLERTIDEHRRRKDVLRRASWALHIGAMASGAASTILLGLQVDSESYLVWSRNMALIISAAGALMTGLLTFWNLDTYWVKRKVILNELIVLQEYLRYIRALAPDALPEEMQSIFERYLAIIGQHTDYWEGMLSHVLTREGRIRTVPDSTTGEMVDNPKLGPSDR